jgi:signal peptidase I
VIVPKGHAFVLGDNRVKGQDSRTWGFLPLDRVKGKATVVWFSRGADARAGNVLGVRWNRLLTKVN